LACGEGDRRQERRHPPRRTRLQGPARGDRAHAVGRQCHRRSPRRRRPPDGDRAGRAAGPVPGASPG
jgi:hypothetical protein